MLHHLTINEKWPGGKRAENQHAVYRACIEGHNRRIVVRAGRKFGKTFTAVRVARDWAAKNPGEIILIAAPEYPYLRDQVVPELRKAIPNEAVKGGWGVGYNKSEHILTLANEAQIFLRTMENADAVRPLSVAGLIAEEFSLWSSYAWNECVRPTLMAKAAPALFIFTPKGMNQAHELWTRAVNGEEGYKPFHFTSYDGTIPKEIIDAEAATMPEGVRRQEIYAEFLEDLGGVFTGVRKCIAGDLEEPEAGETYVIGCDLAKTQNFTVMCVLKRSSRALVHLERFSQLDWEFQVAKVQAASKHYNGAVVWLDSTGLGDPIYDRLHSLGAPVKGYKFTQESKRKLVENLSLAISQGDICYPDIPELVNELGIYTAKQLPGGGVNYGAPAGYHDDCVMALGLARWGLGKAYTTDRRPVHGAERVRLSL